MILKAGLLALVLPAAAQVHVDGLSVTSLSGMLAPGYTADYGNQTSSDHTWTLGGSATLAGAYYKPSFLSYNASVYVNQSRANSNYQSISSTSGAYFTANLFGGSRFPGSVSYSKAFDSEGSYSVPGVANYVTHGNTDNFSINWSENIPNAPSFSAGYQLGNSQYTVYGSTDHGSNSFHSLNLHSGYSLMGFNMGAYYNLGGNHSLIPEIVSSVGTIRTQTDNSAEGFNVAHSLPLQGSISAAYSRSTWDTNALGYRTNGTIDLVNALAAVHPTAKFALSFSTSYTDNLAGQLIQQVVSGGGTASTINNSQPSNSLDLTGVATYSPQQRLQTSAFVERRSQTFLGESYGVNSFGGNTAYSHLMRNGTLNATVTVVDNEADKSGSNSLGFSANTNYTTHLRNWDVTALFGYSQNVQTLLITYMSSSYNFSGTVRRKFGDLIVSAGAGGARTGLTQDPGATNSSQSYNASIGYGSAITATGNYTKGNGQALATGGGLIPTPPPVPPSNSYVLFGGDSYSFAVSASPVDRFIVSVSYSKSHSNTTSSTVASANQNNQLNALVQYQVRKLHFTSGFARLEQGFSGSKSAPQDLSSFYIGVARWFNFF
ncbi:MAG: hypothetical protein WCE75_09575 [Terracidiphilus sp.]